MVDPRLETEFQAIAVEVNRCRDAAFDFDYVLDKLAQDDDQLEALIDVTLKVATQAMALLAAIKAFQHAAV